MSFLHFIHPSLSSLKDVDSIRRNLPTVKAPLSAVGTYTSSVHPLNAGLNELELHIYVIE
jgi:hypothetical protein